MAVLTATGITFGDSTNINSKYGIIPQGTPVVFFQANAPTGWTRVTTHNNKALRVVSGTGAGSGGVNTFTGTFSNVPLSGNFGVSISGLSVNATTVSWPQMAVHAHPANSGGNNNTGNAAPNRGSRNRVAPGGGTANNGGGGSHNHGVNFSAANGSFATSVDMRVQYIDVIYCTFN
jgi:hypothetical protein